MDMQDEFAGQGGSYVIEKGNRKRVEQTLDHPDGHRAREAQVAQEVDVKIESKKGELSYAHE